MATYYVVKDTSNPGKLKYRPSSWPTMIAGTGNVTLTTILNLANSNTIVLSGGTAGLTYSGTELGTSGTLSSYRANVVIRNVQPSDPAYSSHNGPVTFEATSGGILLSTVSMSNFYFTGFTFKSTSSGGASMLFDLNTTSGTFYNCNVVNNYGSHTSSVALVRGATSSVTFDTVYFSGTGNNIFIQQNNGTMTIANCNLDASSITSNSSVNFGGTGIVTLIRNSIFKGNTGSSSGNMAVSSGACSSFVFCNNTVYNYGLSPMIVSASSTNVSIYENTIYNCKGYGINNSSASAQIFGNLIHDITYSGNGLGIYINAANCSIYKNTIYNIDAVGVYCVGNTNKIYSNVVSNCWNGSIRGSGGSGSGIVLAVGASGNEVYDNYVYNNFRGISVANSSGTGANEIYSNLVYYNYVNDIDQQEDAGVNHELIFNNTVIHSPDYVISGNSYIGHGIAVHVLAKKSKVINNLVIINQAIATCDGLEYSQTSVNLVEVISDYNLVYSTVTDGNLGTLDFIGYKTMSGWRAALIAYGNGKIKGLDGTVNSVEAHSLDTNPLLTSDFKLPINSPCIGSGLNSVWSGKLDKLDFVNNPITDSSGALFNRYVGGTRITAVDIGACQRESDPLSITGSDLSFDAKGGYFNSGNPYMWYTTTAGITCTISKTENSHCEVSGAISDFLLFLYDGKRSLINKMVTTTPASMSSYVCVESPIKPPVFTPILGSSSVTPPIDSDDFLLWEPGVTFLWESGIEAIWDTNVLVWDTNGVLAYWDNTDSISWG